MLEKLVKPEPERAWISNPWIQEQENNYINGVIRRKLSESSNKYCNKVL